MHDTEGTLASIKRRIATATASWARAASLAEIRASFDALFADDEPGDFETFAIGTMRAAWIEPPVDAKGRTILFCHGGGFQVGSIRSHLGLIRRLADAAEARVLAFEYRLAPEHKYPTAIEDAFAAYRWLLDQGLPASHIAIAGDSAGAALAIQVALRARDQRVAVPACAALISPWLDLTMRGASYASRAAADIFSKPEQLAAMTRAYLGRNQIAGASIASPWMRTCRDCHPSWFTQEATTLRSTIHSFSQTARGDMASMCGFTSGKACSTISRCSAIFRRAGNQ